MPLACVVDRWISDGESSARRDSPLLPDGWSYTLSPKNLSHSRTMEEITFSLKHYWRFVDSEALELQALSWRVNEKAA